jgi:hypothetical protein
LRLLRKDKGRDKPLVQSFLDARRDRNKRLGNCGARRGVQTHARLRQWCAKLERHRLLAHRQYERHQGRLRTAMRVYRRVAVYGLWESGRNTIGEPNMKNLILIVSIMLFSFPAGAQERVHWYNSKKFWISFGISAAATMADYRESQGAFSRGAVESDPIFGASRPSLQRMTIIGLPITFGYSYAGYKLSRSHVKIIRDFWWMPPSYETAIHTEDAIDAARFGRQSAIFRTRPFSPLNVR